VIEICFHGRGGQGAVGASKILASALFNEGKQVLAFPAFGAERRGAPVKAFLRVSDREIRRRSMIYRPDVAIILDATLLQDVEAGREVKEGGWVVVNTPDPPESLRWLGKYRLATVDADSIAERLGLGSRAMPHVNTAMLGASARATGLISMEPLARSIRENISSRADENVQGALEAYEKLRTYSVQ